VGYTLATSITPWLVAAWLIAVPAASVGYTFATCTLAELLTIRLITASAVGPAFATCFHTQLYAALLVTALATDVDSALAT